MGLNLNYMKQMMKYQLYGVEFELYEADDEISVISKTNGKLMENQ